MSSILFYGHSAKSKAVEHAQSKGRLLAQPFEPPIKVDTAREIVSLSSAPPIGSAKGMIVFGLDKATDKVMDTFLKTLEDHDSDRMDICVWVSDLGSVIPTVKSRCFQVWCGAEHEEDKIPHNLDECEQLLKDLKNEYIAESISVILKTKSSVDDLLKGITYCLTKNRDMEMWQRLRPLYALNRPTKLELACALFDWRDNNGKE